MRKRGLRRTQQQKVKESRHDFVAAGEVFCDVDRVPSFPQQNQHLDARQNKKGEPMERNVTR